MAYVTPATSLEFFRDVSLTPDYQDTLYFASASDRDSYFDNSDYLIARAANCTVQRENRNSCRVEIPISTLYHATYMRFRNATFENKWYYAFVLQVNYINNVTTEVVYQIDYMMTWMGDFVLFPSFVERESVYTDDIGEHYLDEGLGLGDYVIEDTEISSNYGSGNCYIRLIYADPTEDGHMWGGIYNSCQYVDATAASAITDKLTELVNADLTSNIVNIQMVPTKFSNPGSAQQDKLNFDKPYSTVAGYTPKNKKLFTYPYKFLRVDNSEGSQKDYKYELFQGSNASQYGFTIEGISANNVEIACEPNDYSTMQSSETVADHVFRLGMSHFPQGCFAVDTYKAYLAQKNAYLEHDIVQNNPQLRGTALGRVAGGQLSDELGGTNSDRLQSQYLGSLAGTYESTARHIGFNLINASKTVDSVQQTMIDNLIQPEAGTVLHGSPTTDLMFSTGNKYFSFMEMSIRPEVAKSIDDYFSMFGYKVNKIEVPPMNNRETWTYVKTNGCQIHGNIPAYDLSILTKIFDNGVRFWKEIGNIGNFSLSNNPLG